MKRKICFALVLVLVCAQLLTGTSYASYLPGDTVVYVTDYGEKYHNEGCGALWNSCYSISLYKAVQRGYTRCDRCWPGQLDPDWRPPESSPSPSPSPVLSPNPSPVPSPSPSRVLSPSTSPEPSETPFDLSKYPSYAAMQSGSPSPDTPQKTVEPPTDFEMFFAVLGLLLMLVFSTYVLIKQSLDRFERKQNEKEARHRALEKERQEMVLRRAREAEANRLAIEQQRREEEARRVAEQQAIEQQRRKEEIGRLVDLLNIVKHRREEEEKRISEQRHMELQRQKDEAKYLAEMEALELQYHAENAKLLEEQRTIELQSREKVAEFLAEKRAIAKDPKYRKRGKRRTYDEKRAEYEKMYGGVPAEQLAGMPVWVEIGPDGLPKERDTHGLGNYFTYYITAHGKCIHKKRGCCGAYIPIHVLNARAKFMSYCSKCCPWPYPDLSWYSKYLKIKQIKQKYNID